VEHKKATCFYHNQGSKGVIRTHEQAAVFTLKSAANNGRVHQQVSAEVSRL